MAARATTTEPDTPIATTELVTAVRHALGDRAAHVDCRVIGQPGELIVPTVHAALGG
jgi:hypothetical protein